MSTATAAIIPRYAVTSSGEYIWDIIKWQAGESHGAPTAPTTGWYDFNISAPEYRTGATLIPAFFAHCSGTADGQPLGSEYSNCDLEKADESANVAVLARVLPDPDLTQAHIAISYLFSANYEPRTKHNYTVVIVEDWARERPPHNFTTKPSKSRLG
ncbi:hypothetical protein F5Y11DRAFT_344812 [Daldinia sp. FL1419]|nr:hypothetical protein F5Y11DRAFT_344812 [Daldinia sp. FL1419]